ncbi:MAG: phosphatidylglycerophosphatase A [Pseudomonadota bacterium]
MKLGDRSVVFLATGAMVGFVPVAPGTVGTLLGIPIAYGLSLVSLGAALVLLLVLTAVAAWISGQAERIFASKDPGRIVIDEILGMAVTLVGLPFNGITVCIGFILFRYLDITKPPPIRWFDQRLKGGWGVVMDDVAAGVIANLLIRIGMALFSG